MKFIFVAACLTILFFALPVSAGEQNEAQMLSASADMPIFNSPLKNAEKLRRDSQGSSRGFHRSLMTRRSGELTRGLTRSQKGQADKKTPGKPPSMVPLVPETSGFTSKSQPVLMWYASGPWPDKMEFRVNAFRSEEPLLDTGIDGPVSEGVFHVSLADYGVSLKADVEYEWFLTIVFDEDDRSADYFISGTIVYREPFPNTARDLENAPEDHLYFAYAKAGYWYDALAHLSQGIHARPHDSELRRHRAKLLEQVNLPTAAAYDIGQIPEK